MCGKHLICWQTANYLCTYMKETAKCTPVWQPTWQVQWQLPALVRMLTQDLPMHHGLVWHDSDLPMELKRARSQVMSPDGWNLHNRFPEYALSGTVQLLRVLLQADNTHFLCS